MAGHNVIEHLRQSNHSYSAGHTLTTNVISVGNGAPGAATPGLVYIRTDGTAEDTRLYLRGDPAADDWTAVVAP